MSIETGASVRDTVLAKLKSPTEQLRLGGRMKKPCDVGEVLQEQKRGYLAVFATGSG